MLLILVAIPLHAEVTKEDYARAEKFLRWNASKLIFKKKEFL